MKKYYSDTDKEIFQRISEGDEIAFARIFTSWYQPLFWHALKILKSEFWAEEIIQEVFALLWINRIQLADINNPGAYLYKMVTNKALDRIRKQKLEVKIQYFIAMQPETEQGESDDGKWKRELLLKAIESLPEQRRLVYELRFQQGISYDEIAQKLSISKNTVRNQIVKALDTIRRLLINKKEIFLLFTFSTIIFLKFF